MGLLLSTGLAVAAYLLGSQFPIVGGPVFGIALGIAVGSTGLVGPVFRPGITFASKQVLQGAIIVLGAGLSLGQIVRTGSDSLAVMPITMAVGLVAAAVLGRVLKVPGRLTALIGVGTGICGASAIAAVSPLVEAEDQDVAYAISTIFAFNIAAVLIFPLLGHLMGLSQNAFGLWAGTAINDTSSVVAASYSFGQEAGTYATVVKLTRSTMIIPIVLGIALFKALTAVGTGGGMARVNLRRVIPWFIVWFLVAAVLNTVGILPAVVTEQAPVLGKFLIVVALTAVGLSANFKQMVKTGHKPILLGLLLWATVAGTSLLVQRLTGQM